MAREASIDDVCACVLSLTGPISRVKLHRLLYYAQAWHLAWSGHPLYRERIEAWANGPILPDLWARQPDFSVERWDGDARALSEEERSSVEAVVKSYAPLSSSQIEHLVKNEAPWRDTRHGLPPTERSHRPIGRERLRDFYRALDSSAEAMPVDEVDWQSAGLAY